MKYQIITIAIVIFVLSCQQRNRLSDKGKSAQTIIDTRKEDLVSNLDSIKQYGLYPHYDSCLMFAYLRNFADTIVNSFYPNITVGESDMLLTNFWKTDSITIRLLFQPYKGNQPLRSNTLQNGAGFLVSLFDVNITTNKIIRIGQNESISINLDDAKLSLKKSLASEKLRKYLEINRQRVSKILTDIIEK